MANTSFITRVIEPAMIEWVSREFGVELSKKRVKISNARTTVHFEVDGISADGTIACFASSSNSYKVGQIRKLFFDAAILLNLPAANKIMVFLEDGRSLWEAFTNTCDGLLDLSPIKPKFCPIPAEMKSTLLKIQDKARIEVGYLGVQKKVPSRRR